MLLKKSSIPEGPKRASDSLSPDSKFRSLSAVDEEHKKNHIEQIMTVDEHLDDFAKENEA